MSPTLRGNNFDSLLMQPANVSSPCMKRLQTGRNPRSRACGACREAKTKCIVIPGQTKCKQCQKHERPCVVPIARKTRMKTAEKFAALEKQMQVLSTALEAQNTTTVTGSLALDQDAPILSKATMTGDMTAFWPLNSQTKQLLVSHWNLSMQPYFPVIGSIDAKILAYSVEQMPVLSLTIICVASFAILPAISTGLLRMTNQELLRRVYICEEQSTELVSSLLLHCQFLACREEPHEFRFNPHTYTAGAMAVDLGLDDVANSLCVRDSRSAAGAARVWLARYCVMSVSTSLLKRQQIVYEDLDLESVKISLLKSKYSIGSDASLCDLVSLHQIVNTSSKTTSTKIRPTWDDCTIISQTTHLNQLLEKWRHDTLTRSTSARLNMTVTFILHSVVKLYIHRLAIIDFRLKFVALFAPSQTSPSLQEQDFSFDHVSLMQKLHTNLSVDHLRTLNICVDLCQQALYQFASLPVSTARDLPLLYYHWMLFTVVCLLKLAPFAETPRRMASRTSEDNEELALAVTIDEQLRLYKNKLEAICQNDHVPHLKVFLGMARRLQSYYTQKKDVCMNSKVDGCDHSLSNGGRRALNLLRDDDRDNEDNLGLAESNPNATSFHDRARQDLIDSDLTDNIEMGMNPEYDEEFIGRFDEFFGQEEDEQWLALLNWDWT